jgi:hypothetical protein
MKDCRSCHSSVVLACPSKWMLNLSLSLYEAKMAPHPVEVLCVCATAFIPKKESQKGRQKRIIYES